MRFLVLALVGWVLFLSVEVSPAYANNGQVAYLLRQAAARNALPANLVLSIAWQESGWRQVISPGGDIGVMQLSPPTARILQMRNHYNPYTIFGNIALGAIYLHMLWWQFRGNLVKTISAYNEGGGNVLHRGIFNWGYVNRVLALMRKF